MQMSEPAVMLGSADRRLYRKWDIEPSNVCFTRQACSYSDMAAMGSTKNPCRGDKGCPKLAVPYLASFPAWTGTLPRWSRQAAGLHRAVSLHLS